MNPTSPRGVLCALVTIATLLGAGRSAAAPTVERLVSSPALADAWFGHAVAMDGDTLVVGAPMDDTFGDRAGIVTVFTRTASAWVEHRRLAGSDVQSGDMFGWSVALDGDLLAVGAPGEDDRGTSAGAVWVFRRTAGTWNQVAKLTADDGAKDDNFGVAVAASGDTVAVGAPKDDDLGNASGTAYVFRDGPGGFAFEQHLLAGDGGEFHNFGDAIALDGNVIVAGAPTASGDGGAYVFERADTTWTESKKLLPAESAPGAKIGSAVAVRGDTILVGVREQGDVALAAGAVFVYRNGMNGWEREGRLDAPAPAEADVFGNAVALGEDIAVVGAIGVDHTQVDDAGVVFVFTRDGTTWSYDRGLTAAHPGTLDLFGNGVAISGAAIAIGAPLDDDEGDDSGTVTVFDEFEPPAEVDGFVLPSKIDVRLAAAKRGGKPGLRLRGMLDTGSVPLDAAAPATFRVGQRLLEFAAPESIKNGKALRYTTEGAQLTLTPDRRGSSRVLLSVATDAAVAAAAVPMLDGPVPMRLVIGALDAPATVHLVGGRLRTAKSGGLVEPAVLPTAVKARVRGVSRDSVKLTAAYDGSAPVGSIRVRVGDSVDLVIPVVALVLRKNGRLEFRGTTGGISKLTLDPARGRISARLEGVDLGAVVGSAVVPMTIGIDLGDGAPPVRVLLSHRKSVLRY